MEVSLNMQNNQKGLTLVEILAAITILSIVLLTFSSLFLQSSKFTNSNKDRLSEIEVAEEIVGTIRSSQSFKDLTGIKKDNVIVNQIPIKNLINSSYVYNHPESNYVITITLSNGPANTTLRKAVIKVEDLEGQPAELFTTEMYIEDGL